MGITVIPENTEVGPFRIQRALAKGGMAIVYQAVEPRSGREVAVKVSRFAETDRRYGNALRFEADLLEQLEHPNIVNIVPIPLPGAKIPPSSAKAVQLSGHPWYYSMEFLNGNSLTNYVAQGGILPADVVSATMYQVCRGLLYLHKQGYAHLDIKTDNILFRYPLEKGALIHAVLVDFGVAAQTSLGNEAAGGTLLIMAPERLAPPEDDIMQLDAGKMDVYSVGVTMYRVLTGQYPFAGMNQRALIRSILNSPVIAPRNIVPDLPVELNTLVLDALAKDPEDRISLQALIANLEKLPYRIARLTRDIMV